MGGIAGSIPSANIEAVKAIVAAYLRSPKRGGGTGLAAPRFTPCCGDSASECRGLGGSAKTTSGRCVQAAGLWLPRRIGYLPFDAPDFGKSDGGTVPGCRHVEPSGDRDLSDPGGWLKASLAIPVAPRDIPYGQYPIGDAAQWQKIVENLAAMVRELDRSFVPEIEQAAGPSPAWYQPAS